MSWSLCSRLFIVESLNFFLIIIHIHKNIGHTICHQSYRDMFVLFMYISLYSIFSPLLLYFFFLLEIF